MYGKRRMRSAGARLLWPLPRTDLVVLLPLVAAAAGIWGVVHAHNHRHHQQLLGPVHFTASVPPVPGYGPPHVGQRVVGSALSPPPAAGTIEQCAAACHRAGSTCAGFNWAAAGSGRLCELSTWGPNYVVMQNISWVYYSRTIERNDTAYRAAIKYQLQVPTRSVWLTGDKGSSPFLRAFETNLDYLRQYPVDDVLYWFRIRAGQSNPVGAKNWGWDGHGPDMPYGLKGSVAGLYMMGLGGALRWKNDTELWQRLSSVVGNISALQEADGYAMAFPRNETNYHENPNYVTSWVTHGLLEAHVAGQTQALSTLRKHFDWFNYAADMLAQFLPPCSGPGTPGGPWSGCSAQAHDHGHSIYLIKQGIIHNTRLASSSVGTHRDVQVVAELYQETWWLEQLKNRSLESIWQRHYYPHNYEITAFEAYLDMYVLTGDRLYMDAMEGAWEMFRDQWIHVGGSIAMNEGRPYPPASYFLDHSPTGELCGSSFWIRFNQRFQRLRPAQEIYTLEIERSLFNVVLANQGTNNGIRYFAQLVGKKANPTAIATCCESQATRTYGALPEFIYSTSEDGESEIFVNLFIPSSFVTRGGTIVNQTTNFPTGGMVTLTVSAQTTVMLRVPAWLSTPTVTVNIDEKSVVGKAGTYLQLRSKPGGSVINASFPMSLRVSPYNGTTPSPPVADEGCQTPDGNNSRTRAAVEWGPILLAAVASDYAKANVVNCSVGAADVSDLSIQGSFTIQGIDITRSTPASWLVPSAVPVAPHAFSFDVRGNPCVSFVPYFSVQTEEMSVYPAFRAHKPGVTQPQLCSLATENWPAETNAVCLACPSGKVIDNVTRAEFGVIHGTCTTGLELNQSCLADSTMVEQYVASRCIGASGCTVTADTRHFGKDPCIGVYKQLAVEVSCGTRQCDIVNENFPQETHAVNVGCEDGYRISTIIDAEFGEIKGKCPNFEASGCHSDPTAVRKVAEARCLGKASCTVPANVAYFGKDPCRGVVKQLAIRVNCTRA